MFEENQFPLNALYYALLNIYSIASINCADIRCGPFILSRLKMEEDRRGIGVGMIGFVSVEDYGFYYEVALRRVALSILAIGDSVKDGVNFVNIVEYPQW